MPLHPCFADKLHLLEGMVSIESALADPAQAPRVAEFMSHGESQEPRDAHTRDDVAPGPHGPVRLRIYRPIDSVAQDLPGLVWVHGGGWRIGSIDDPSTDATAREMCARVGAVVVTVDYRLAVDGVSYPVPHDDVVAAVRWVRDGAADLGIDPARITVGGDSAGGNLSAGAVLRLRDEDRWTPAALVMVYPLVHTVVPPMSAGHRAAVSQVPDLLRFLPADVEELTRNYLGGPESTADGYAMPALAVLEGLCPTLVVNAECDDLRASGEAFVADLARAGVDVRQVTAPGMLHSFLMLPDAVEPAGRVRALIAETVRTAFSAPDRDRVEVVAAGA
jgi:acetyl esterase